MSVSNLSSYDVSLPPIEDLNSVVLPACLYLVVEAFSSAALNRFLNDSDPSQSAEKAWHARLQQFCIALQSDEALKPWRTSGAYTFCDLFLTAESFLRRQGTTCPPATVSSTGVVPT